VHLPVGERRNHEPDTPDGLFVGRSVRNARQSACQPDSGYSASQSSMQSLSRSRNPNRSSQSAMSNETLTAQEEEELLHYLAFIRKTRQIMLSTGRRIRITEAKRKSCNPRGNEPCARDAHRPRFSAYLPITISWTPCCPCRAWSKVRSVWHSPSRQDWVLRSPGCREAPQREEAQEGAE